MARTVLPRVQRKARVDTSLAIINIVLLLIFFFLATGSLMNSPSFGVDISETTELPIDLLPQPILVVGPTGDFLLNGDEIASEDLADALLDDPVLHVLIDKDAPASELLDLLNRDDLLATEIRLVTLHLRKAEEGGS